MALSLQSLGKELFQKTTLELGVEKSIADSQAKLAVLSSLDKAGVEVRESKRLWIKRKRVEVKNYEDFIKALEDYAKISNQPLTVEQVYFALKDLEKGARGEVKDKIRAIRREVEKREGVKLRRIVYASALGILGLAAFATWYLSQDHKAPEIEKVDYKDRVNKGEEQEVSVKVFEENPDSAVLKFNSSSIQIPLAQKFDNGTAFYKTSFDPASILAREGLFNAELIVKDRNGNEAKQSLSFLANLEAPAIGEVKVEKVGIGKYSISTFVHEPNLKEAYVEVNGRKVALTGTGPVYRAEVDLGCDEADEMKIRAEDNFSLSSSRLVRDFMSEDDRFELKLYCQSPSFREIYGKNPSLAYQLLDQVLRDSRVSDKLKVAVGSFDILSSVGIYDLKKHSIHIPGNYSQALAQGLPEHSAVDIKRLIGASESCDDIVDFEPVIIRDVTGNEIRIESKNVARDYWIVCEFLKNRPEIASQPKKFEWINRMVQQIAWDIFDDEYGPSFYDKKTYKPTDSEVWQVILGFHDYMDKLPEKLVKDNIPIVFPYWDSEQLRQAIADKTNRTIALFYLADVPAKSFDEANYISKENEAWNLYNQGKIDGNTLGKIIDQAYKESIISGINAMKKFVEQLPLEYEEIRKLYPNGKVGIYNEDPRGFYKDWLSDRFCHGLENTVGQYVGFDNETIKYFKDKNIRYLQGDQWAWNELEFRNKMDQSNGIDQFLTNNWKPWDLIKFIYGYERFKSAEWGGEWEMYKYGLPLAFKALGIPAGVAEHGANFGINSDPFLINQGAPGSEWAVTLPDNVIQQLRKTFLNNKIITDYANRISLFSSIDGLLRDSSSVQWIGTTIRDKTVYLWEKK